VRRQIGEENTEVAGLCRTLKKLCINVTHMDSPTAFRCVGAEVQSAAGRLAKHVKIKNVSASSGWLQRVRNRHGLHNQKLCGKAVSAYKGGGGT
jgi:hypothetical protein